MLLSLMFSKLSGNQQPLCKNRCRGDDLPRIVILARQATAKSMNSPGVDRERQDRQKCHPEDGYSDYRSHRATIQASFADLDSIVAAAKAESRPPLLGLLTVT
jgi:hypothetical protein